MDDRPQGGLPELGRSSALGDGYEVHIVPDASGGGDAESHTMGVQRMVQAGAVALSTLAYLSELQRDWAREATVPAVLQIFSTGTVSEPLFGGSGTC